MVSRKTGEIGKLVCAKLLACNWKGKLVTKLEFGRNVTAIPKKAGI